MQCSVTVRMMMVRISVLSLFFFYLSALSRPSLHWWHGWCSIKYLPPPRPSPVCTSALSGYRGTCLCDAILSPRLHYPFSAAFISSCSFVCNLGSSSTSPL
ncbi:hypothetical protein BDW66DRAFT_124813 [Aspergillus desertorum]